MPGRRSGRKDLWQKGQRYVHGVDNQTHDVRMCEGMRNTITTSAGLPHDHRVDVIPFTSTPCGNENHDVSRIFREQITPENSVLPTNHSARFSTDFRSCIELLTFFKKPFIPAGLPDYSGAQATSSLLTDLIIQLRHIQSLHYNFILQEDKEKMTRSQNVIEARTRPAFEKLMIGPFMVLGEMLTGKRQKQCINMEEEAVAFTVERVCCHLFFNGTRSNVWSLRC